MNNLNTFLCLKIALFQHYFTHPSNQNMKKCPFQKMKTYPSTKQPQSINSISHSIIKWQAVKVRWYF